MRSSAFFFLIFSVLATAAATAAEPFKTELARLRHMDEAPAPIAQAGKAVVEIEMATGGGTGFFMSEDGLLATNHHVVPPEDCPANGCFLTLKRNFIGKGVAADVGLYFLTPVLTLTEYDITVLQVWAAPPKERHLEPTQKLKTPDYIKPGTSTSAVGDTIYVVGHPALGVQRWTGGKLHKKSGDWRGANLMVLSGMSGSPILNEAGEVKGIVHRSMADAGYSALDLNQLRGVGYYTSWSAFERFWENHKDKIDELSLDGYVYLPADPIVSADDFAEFMESVELTDIAALMQSRRTSVISMNPESDDEDEMDEGDGDIIPKKKKAAKAKPKKQRVGKLKVSSLLLKICDLEVKSEEAMAEPEYGYSACVSALDWIECRKPEEVQTTEIVGLTPKEAKNWDYKFCPDKDEQEEWTKLFGEVAELLELKNQDAVDFVTSAAGIFETTTEKQIQATKADVTKYLATHPDITLLERASAIAAYADSLDEEVADGWTLGKVLKEYSTVESREMFLEPLFTAFESMYDGELAVDSPLTHFANTFSSDPRVPVVLKIDLEAVVSSGALHKTKPKAIGSKYNRRTRSLMRTGFQKKHKSTDAFLKLNKDLSRIIQLP